MTTVYQPPPDHRHTEHLSKFAELKDINKIEKCTCGKYFYMWDVSYGTSGAFNWRFYACWSQVRWYHWRKQKLIREWENKKVDDFYNKGHRSVEEIEGTPPND